VIYTATNAKQELAYEIEKGYADFEQLRDRLGEFVDSALPIYYSDIIAEWQQMPSDYDGRGVLDFGLPAEPTVYSLMLGDLYAYYYDLMTTALDELESESN
jgi:hypothetical protein